MVLVIPSHPKPEKDFAQVRQNGISYTTELSHFWLFKSAWCHTRSIRGMLISFGSYKGVLHCSYNSSWNRNYSPSPQLRSQKRVICKLQLGKGQIRSLKVKLSNFVMLNDQFNELKNNSYEILTLVLMKS